MEIAERDYGIRGAGEGSGISVNSAVTENRSRSDEPPAHRDGGGLGAGIDAELGEEVGDVGLHGAGADEERFGDLPVGTSLDQQAQYVEFPTR